MAGAHVVRAALDLPRVVTLKGSFDLVTNTDRESEAAILSVLNAERPDDAVLGEEGGVSGPVSSPFLWTLDPVDGTTKCVRSSPAKPRACQASRLTSAVL